MYRIAALASGGVDSSVAIHLLCEQGYKPDMFYIKIGMADQDQDFTCSQEEDIEMCRWIANKYNLKFTIVDLQKEYWDYVIGYTLKTIKAGGTPNPDVMCNHYIKFGAFNEKYGKDYDFIATGHYATIAEIHGSTAHPDRIYKAIGTSPDPVKDQTDFLCQLTTDQVQKAIFPIGNMTKDEVRKIAEENGLINAKRKDSQGICFLGKINYNEFVEKYLGTNPGNIKEYHSGKILGQHKGLWFHTIGQRKGLCLSGGPWYVIEKNYNTNTLYVSNDKSDLQISKNGENRVISLINFNNNTLSWPSGNLTYNNKTPITFKIRHSPEFHTGVIHYTEGDSKHHYYYEIIPDDFVGGVAAGQYCTVYSPDHKIMWGSGEIVIRRDNKKKK